MKQRIVFKLAVGLHLTNQNVGKQSCTHRIDVAIVAFILFLVVTHTFFVQLTLP